MFLTTGIAASADFKATKLCFLPYVCTDYSIKVLRGHLWLHVAPYSGRKYPPMRARIRIRVPVRARPTTKVSELTYNTLQVSKFECPPND